MIEAFLRAWLMAWLLGLGTSVGCLLLLLLHHIVDGRWGEVLRPALEAGARSLPVWAVGLLPLALGTEALYAWTDPEVMASDASLRHKAWYLCSVGYVVRSLISLSLWSVLALRLTDARAPSPRAGLASFGLITTILSATISATDWLASLDPAFSSSMFGLYVVMGQVLAGLSAALVLTVARRRLDEADSVDLGQLLLVILTLWIYVAFSQYLLIWSGDLPAQSAWYLARATGPWRPLMIAIVLVRVGVVLPALLMRAITRVPARLACLAVALLSSYVLEIAYLVLPAELPAALPLLTWLDLALPLAVALTWAWLALRLQQARERSEVRDA